ncbi:MAG TPA: lyase family protein, partial [Burkholderiaceae bacterium]|nr:lyase family protein [Burkholderiaceae bacterium]
MGAGNGNLTRTEVDGFGSIEVPRDALWGAQTERSRRFFDIGTQPMPLPLIHAMAEIKRAAAEVNLALGLLDERKATAIARAAARVAAGEFDTEFPLSQWQTGSGTQSHMNVNEVIANLASRDLGGEVGPKRLVHPNDDVNLGQSSNDVFPTAMHVAAVLHARPLIGALEGLRGLLRGRAVAFAEALKIGRTHLQDATPLTLGQEFSGYVAQLDHGLKHVEAAIPHLAELALGGTAVGTGLNAHPEYAVRVAKKLAELTDLPFVTAPNKFEALAANDALVHAHGALKTL